MAADGRWLQHAFVCRLDGNIWIFSSRFSRDRLPGWGKLATSLYSQLTLLLITLYLNHLRNGPIGMKEPRNAIQIP